MKLMFRTDLHKCTHSNDRNIKEAVIEKNRRGVRRRKEMSRQARVGREEKTDGYTGKGDRR